MKAVKLFSDPTKTKIYKRLASQETRIFFAWDHPRKLRKTQTCLRGKFIDIFTLKIAFFSNFS